MKPKTTDFTEEYQDLVEVMALAKFLIKLKIPSSTELYSDACDTHDETFCDECEHYRDDCSCRESYRAEYDDGADYED